MKWLSIAILILTLTGCAGVAESVIDPAGYTQRSQAQAKARSDEAFAESQRWLAEGQKAQADQARSNAEARSAEADARAAQAQAEAYAKQSEAFTALGQAIQEAGKPNNAPVIVAILSIVFIAAWSIWNSNKTAQSIATNGNHAMLAPPASVQLIADRQGLTPTHDGTRWLLLDGHGQVVQRQRLIG